MAATTDGTLSGTVVIELHQVQADSMGSQTEVQEGEQQQTQPSPSGNYQKLSRFMGRWPEMSIFRRFGSLNAQNILFLQAELAHLEYELGEIREEDSNSDDETKKKFAQSWYEVSQKPEDGEQSEQYQKILEIREKLSEYSKPNLRSSIQTMRN